MLFKILQFLSKIIPQRILVASRALPIFRRTGEAFFGRLLTAQGIRQVTVAAGPGAGLKMKLKLENERFLWLGIHEPEVQNALLNLASPNMVVYDIGAYVGFFSLLMARHCTQVIAFEPNPSSRERLKQNVILNHLLNCQIYPQAISDRQGEELFHPSKNSSPLQGHLDDPDYPLSSRTPPVKPFPVPVTSLDDFVYNQGHPPPELVKIDVEGGEVRVIKGMSRLLRQQRPLIICEVHNHMLAEKTAALLREAGYQTQDLESGKSQLPTPDDFQQRHYLMAKPLPIMGFPDPPPPEEEKPSRKVLLVTSVGKGAIGGAFLRAFSSLGHQVQLINNRDYFPLRISIPGRIKNHLQRERSHQEYNRVLLEKARSFRPDWLIILKGTLIKPEILEMIRTDLCQTKIVNINYDDFFSRSPGNVFPDLERVIPSYDIFFPSKKANVPELRELGAKRIMYLPIGYDPGIHYPIINPQQKINQAGPDLVFAGTYTPERSRYLAVLADMDMEIWGAYWNQRRADRNLRSSIRNRGIYDTNLATLFCSSRIALNFFRPENRDTHNQRTFEIPACRCFMLSQRSEELDSFFVEGQEYAGFSSPSELREKAKYYLAHDEERQSIAEEGYLRLCRDKHTIRDRVKTICEQLELM